MPETEPAAQGVGGPGARAEPGPEPAAEALRRWLVVGASGAGKSTLARALARSLALPLIHLDRHYWRPGWVEPPAEEWRRVVADLVSGEAWVVDGNYSGTLEQRLARAQAVVFLDLPAWRCVAGIYRRSPPFGGDRPDLPDGCPERLPSLEFLRFVVGYRRRSRPKVLARLEAAPHIRLFRFTTRRAAWGWLRSLRADRGAGSPASRPGSG